MESVGKDFKTYYKYVEGFQENSKSIEKNRI